VLAAGRSQMQVAARAAAIGGHVRVGLEDNLWLDKGNWHRAMPPRSRGVRHIIEGLGLEAATPAEARAMLSLKGGDAVGF